MLSENVFSLSTLETKHDLERLRVTLTAELELELYDLDEGETGDCLPLAKARVADLAP